MINLIGVIIAFIIIIILIRRKYNFGLSLIFGSIIVGIFSIPYIEEPVDIPKAFIEGILYSFEDQQINTLTIELAVLLLLIYILAKCMQELGAINKLIKSLRTVFFKGGTLGVIPAIYGLMPVPGGAIFSAPLIDQEGGKYNLKQNQKNFLNVWWRHIWFPIFPVSSAMVTICSLKFANIDIYELVLADFPAFILFIVIGLFYLKFFIKKAPKPVKPSEKDYKGLIYLLLPLIPILLYILIFAILFTIGDTSILKLYQTRIFIVGVIISIAVLYFLIDAQKEKYFETIKKSLSFNLVLAIFGIMIFREVIEASQANQIISTIIGDLPFPPVIIIIVIPFILGVLTGYNLAGIMLSYFLVEPFFVYSNINLIGLTSIIFISSLAGYLISPIHLCNVVSSDYLKTDTTRIYKMYIPAVVVLLSIQTIFIIVFYSN